MRNIHYNGLPETLLRAHADLRFDVNFVYSRRGEAQKLMDEHFPLPEGYRWITAGQRDAQTSRAILRVQVVNDNEPDKAGQWTDFKTFNQRHDDGSRPRKVQVDSAVELDESPLLERIPSIDPAEFMAEARLGGLAQALETHGLLDTDRADLLFQATSDSFVYHMHRMVRLPEGYFWHIERGQRNAWRETSNAYFDITIFRKGIIKVDIDDPIARCAFLYLNDEYTLEPESVSSVRR